MIELRRKELTEKRMRNLALGLCLILGVIFALSGLFFFSTNNPITGIASTLSSITFMILALAFRSVKVKVCQFEIETRR